MYLTIELSSLRSNLLSTMQDLHDSVPESKLIFDCIVLTLKLTCLILVLVSALNCSLGFPFCGWDILLPAYCWFLSVPAYLIWNSSLRRMSAKNKLDWQDLLVLFLGSHSMFVLDRSLPVYGYSLKVVWCFAIMVQFAFVFCYYYRFFLELPYRQKQANFTHLLASGYIVFVLFLLPLLPSIAVSLGYALPFIFIQVYPLLGFASVLSFFALSARYRTLLDLQAEQSLSGDSLLERGSAMLKRIPLSLFLLCLVTVTTVTTDLPYHCGLVLKVIPGCQKLGLSCFNIGAKICPIAVWNHLELACIYAENGQHDQAEIIVKDAFRTRPEMPEHLKMALLKSLKAKSSK